MTSPANAIDTMAAPSATHPHPTNNSSGLTTTSHKTDDLLPPRSHLDKYGFLFGHPISHSMSPMFHNTIYSTLSLKWQQFFLESPNLSHCLPYLQDPQFYGASVTMPHKIAILPHLDELTEEARACGACNTIYLREEGGERKLVGTNTDVVGVREAFLQNIPAAERDSVYGGRRPGMVVGGGGAARAAVYALVKQMGIDTIYMVNRDEGEVKALMDWCKSQGYGDGMVHVKTLEDAKSRPDLGAVVACVPDIEPVTEKEKEVRSILLDFLGRQHKGAILEMAYHPKPWTTVAELSSKAGWKVLLGTEAMIYQGLAQDQLWTGKTLEELPVEKVKTVIADALAKAVQH